MSMNVHIIVIMIRKIYKNRRYDVVKRTNGFVFLFGPFASIIFTKIEPRQPWIIAFIRVLVGVNIINIRETI
jgi:hypothetical protein